MLFLEYNRCRNWYFKVRGVESTSFEILFFPNIKQIRLFSWVSVHLETLFSTLNITIKQLLQKLAFWFGDHEEHLKSWVGIELFSSLWGNCWIPISVFGTVHEEHIRGITKPIIYCLLLIKIFNPIEILNKNCSKVHVNSTKMLEQSKTDKICSFCLNLVFKLGPIQGVIKIRNLI